MEKIKQLLVASAGAAVLPENALRAFNDLFARQVLSSAGLAVKAGASALAKVSNTVTAIVNGQLVQKTTADLPALTGFNLTSAQVGLGLATMDASGTLAWIFAPPATAIGSLQMPTLPTNQVALGFVLFNTGATFTGGTTAMDTAGISYFNIVGPFYPASQF